MANPAARRRSVLLGIVVGVLAVGAVAVVLVLTVFNRGPEEPVPTTGPEQVGGMGPGVFGRPEGAQAGPAPAVEEEPMPVPAAGIEVAARAAGTAERPASSYPRIAFRPRSDPFALLPVEVAAQREREREALVASIGGFQLFAEPQPRPVHEKLIPPEPQPYRRLSGIVRGEAVAAILEEYGDADTKIFVVKPGDRVVDSEDRIWIVRSIDDKKLVLYREGDTKPNEVVVKLEAVPTVMAGTSGTGQLPGGGPGVGPTTGTRGGLVPGLGPGTGPRGGGGGRGGGGPEL
jgi:hypothetical protein